MFTAEIDTHNVPKENRKYFVLNLIMMLSLSDVLKVPVRCDGFRHFAML